MCGYASGQGPGAASRPTARARKRFCRPAAMERMAAAFLAASLVASSAAQGFPRSCSAYTECVEMFGTTLKDCCPDVLGNTFSCCVPGAARMQLERLANAMQQARAEAMYASIENELAASEAHERAIRYMQEAQVEAMRRNETEKRLNAIKERLASVKKEAKAAAIEAVRANETAQAKSDDVAQQATEYNELNEKLEKEVEDSEKKDEEAANATTSLEQLKLKAEAAEEDAKKLIGKLSRDERLALDANEHHEREVNATRQQREQETLVATEKEKVKAADKEAAQAQEALDKAREEFRLNKSEIEDARCQSRKHPECARFEGFCCPTLVGEELVGEMLECCSTATSTPASLPIAFALSGVLALVACVACCYALFRGES